MSRKREALSFAGEVALWGVANVLCMVAALGAAYGVAVGLLGWGPARLAILVAVVLVLSSTWGSWATLIWTRSRALRAVQQAMTILPGVVMLAGGAALFYLGFGAWYLAAGVLAAGLGMSALSVVLAGGVFTKNTLPSPLQYLLGIGIYPLLTTALSGFVTLATFNFLSTSAHPAGWTDLFSIATLMISVLSCALISTVIPALSSRACQELSFRISSDPR